MNIKSYKYLRSWENFKCIKELITELELEKNDTEEIRGSLISTGSNNNNNDKPKSRKSSWSETGNLSRKLSKKDLVKINGSVVKERVVLLECNISRLNNSCFE
jgi:hypothetical protein